MRTVRTIQLPPALVEEATQLGRERWQHKAKHHVESRLASRRIDDEMANVVGMIGELGAASYLDAKPDRALHVGPDAGHDLTLTCGARISVRTRDARGAPSRPDLLILSNSKAQWTPYPTLALVLQADNVLAFEGLWLPGDPYQLHTFHPGKPARLVRPFVELRDVEEIRAHVASCQWRPA